MKKTLLFCIAILASMTASAEIIKDGFIEYVPNLVKHTAIITFVDFQKVNQDVYTFPSSIKYEDEEYIVTAIADKAVKNGSNNKVCKKIIVPPSIKNIGKHALSYLENVKEFELQSELEQIEKGTFQRCVSLESITLPEGLKVIGNGAFSGCESLKTINIPNSVTEIYANAFQNTKIKELVLPEGITKINEQAFEGMGRLQKIVIPSTVTQIGNYAFKACERLSDVTLPPHLQSIGMGTFSYCVSLVQISLPSEVQTIESEAFYGCSELKEIRFPGSLIYINYSAFLRCPELKSISFSGAIPPRIIFSAFDSALSTVYVPRGCSKRYKEGAGDNSYRPFLDNVNVIEMEVDPDVTILMLIVEDNHKELISPRESDRDETLIIQKYVEVYNYLNPNINAAGNVEDIYRIQQTIKRPHVNLIKKPLAKELKAAKDMDSVRAVFLKYYPTNN